VEAPVGGLPGRKQMIGVSVGAELENNNTFNEFG